MDATAAYKKANDLLERLTIEEKALMVRGYNKFFIKGFEEKGILPIYLSDATQGVNIRNNLPDPNVVKQLERSTAFPSPILLASTFSPDLSYQYAKAIGEECRAGGIEVLLGPGLNIYRQSQCARNFEYFGESVLGLYHQKKITEKDLDDMVRPILATCIAMGFYDRSKYDLSLLDKYQEHEKIARQVAEEGIVLLKNRDNILPLDPTKNRKILLTGKFIYEIPRGYGAAEVIGYNNVSLIEALQRAFGRTVYYIEKPTVADIKEADIVLLSMGTRDKEAIERPFALPKEDESLMRYVTKNNPNTIAILNTGSAIDMSAWNDRLAGLIYGWYGGQSGFEALTDIITGKVTPSGKLPMTIEKTFEDSPAWGYLPKGASLYNELKNEHLINVYDVNYGESVLVGYRWYDTKNIEPLYPFGYGLSYTTFTLIKPRLSSKKMNDQMIRCSVTITNTGSQKGAEVIQLYLKENQPSVSRPEKELKRFKKIFLNSGENQTVEFEITPEDLAFWDDETHDWKVNSGQYSILLGTSSRHISHILSFTKE